MAVVAEVDEVVMVGVAVRHLVPFMVHLVLCVIRKELNMVMVVVMAEDKPLTRKYLLVVTNNEITATYWQSCMGILSLSINCTVPYFDSTISILFQTMALFFMFVLE